MDQAVFYIRIFPGTEAEYDRRHAEIWPELVDEIRESGLRNFSGFRRGTDVWYYTEAVPGTSVEDAFAIHGPKPANQRWNRYFRDVIAEITDEAGQLLWYDKVFESDGPALMDRSSAACSASSSTPSEPPTTRTSTPTPGPT